MIRSVMAAVAAVAILSLSIGSVVAEPSCPAIVAQAREMLNKKMALNPDDVQAPRSQAGPHQVLTQAAPRENQNVQAPRADQDVQAPRGNQDVQAPRENQNVQAPREKLAKAASLVEAAEAACRSGSTAVASQKAKAALKLLK